MHIDIATLLFAMTVCMVTMAIALPAVMGPVNAPARRAQAGVLLQGSGWALLLLSGLAVPGSLADRSLSTLAMAGIGGGLALNTRRSSCGAAAHRESCAGPARGRHAGGLLPRLRELSVSVGWANGLLTVQMAFLVAALWRRPAVAVGSWRWLLVGGLFAQMACTPGRGVLGAFFTETYPTFLAPHPVNYAFAIVANVTTVLSLMAVLLAHRDEAARELERLATVDGLTGVLNRNAWMARAATEMAVSVRYGHPVAVLMIDLDHFKQINDNHGHDAGDRALTFIARALQAAVRPGDLVGRYGGEEFCVLVTHADNAAAGAFDARMRKLPWPRSPSTSSAFRSPTAPASPCATRPTTRSRQWSSAPTPRSTAPRSRAARARSTPRGCACARRERARRAARSGARSVNADTAEHWRR